MTLLKKSELVAAVSEDTNLTKADVERVVSSLQEHITNALVAGKSVKIPGFVAFDPKTSAARTMRNPQTGEKIDVPERKGVKIRPLTSLTTAVRDN